MKSIARILTLPIAALALSGGVAHAQDPQTRAAEVKTVYQGLDAQGRIVKVTVTSSNGAPTVAVAARADGPPLHWTAYIGSGSAAAIAH
jgi:hypothetical protein